MGAQQTVVGRRTVLAGTAAVAGVAALGVAAAAPAEAATTAVIKKVYMYRVGRYRYNATTRVTTVLSYTKVIVTARFYGSKVYLKNSSGAWVQIPYVWSSTKKGLWYSRYLALQIAAAAAYSKLAADHNSGIKVIPPKTFVSAAETYRSNDWARHLLNRAAYGPTAADLASVHALGYAGWLEKQLAPSTIDDSACTAILSRLPDQSKAIWRVRYGIENGTINGWDQFNSVLQDLTVRALWSKRQLLTVLEDFWGNHFNVTIYHDDTAESRAHYAWTIRTHALGKFTDLLLAITKHPAMLTYLNNRESTALHPNENQGRELLELHTVGVDAGYGEDGVLDAARILTGLGVDSDSGEYEFQPWNHWTGAVKVLGFTHANTADTGGEAVADALVRYLAHHPATAKRICHKLAVRFVSDTPSDALVTMLANVYLKNDTNITMVLRALFSSAEFAASIGKKVARPYEHIVSTARLMQIQPVADNLDAPLQLVNLADNAGHNPFGQPFPTGQADTADQWESTATTLVRWNNTISVVSNWYPNDVVRPSLVTAAIGPTLPGTHGELVDLVATNLFGRTLAPEHKTAVLAFLGVTADKAVSPSSAAASYGLNSFVSVLLDSPYMSLR
ncbi:MAG TPA: DUF1800 domain-containing protein [Candidatus Nanopelagicales bacterium]|nr:DUF1800 domain-containing protein [Candidatus Nanopelagicales bacterium]